MRRLITLRLPVVLVCVMATLFASVGVQMASAAPPGRQIACQVGQPCAYWGVMTTANPGAIGNELHATAVVSSSDAWAGGRKWETTSVARRPASRGPKQGCGCAYYALIEHWNGSTWSVVSQPAGADPSSEILGLTAISSNDVWAVGDYINPATSFMEQLIEHWNGSTWSIVAGAGPLAGTKLNAVAGRAANDVWAVGSSGQLASLTEHWNGTAWSVVPSPNATSGGNAVVSPLASVTAFASNDVWAVGSANYGVSTLIEHWDGAQWSIVPSPNTSAGQNNLFGVSGVAANDVWAVGSYLDQGTPVTGGPLVEHWDGASWTLDAAADPPSNQDQFLGVAARTAGEVWAVGSQSDYYLQQYTPLIERWNGAVWGETAEPPLNVAGRQIMTAVAASPDGTVIAVGYYAAANGYYQTLAMLLGRRPR